MHCYVERYKVIATPINWNLIQINLQSVTWKIKNSDLKIKKTLKNLET